MSRRLAGGIPATATAATSTLTPAERSHLAAWGEAEGLEVDVDIDHDGDCPGQEYAFIGPAPGAAEWAVRRKAGQLWLDHIVGADWCAPISSVAEATAMIEAAAGRGRLH